MKRIIYTNKNLDNYPVATSSELYLSQEACQLDWCVMGNFDSFHFQNYPKTKNTFIHVFWSKPAFSNKFNWDSIGQYEITLALSALSLACLKELGQRVILVTDTKGKELLEDLPYDEIHTILDDYDIPKQFWAAGKIIALENFANDTILIDNDLFIYDGFIIDKISNTDVICSAPERNTLDINCYEFCLNTLSWLAKGDTSRTSQTSILKINNSFLKQLFISTYKEGIKLLTNEQGEIVNEIQHIMTPDLVTEQFNFHCLCNPSYVCDSPYWHDVVGFCHLLGHAKYRKLPLVLKKLQNEFSEYYDIVLKKWYDLQFVVLVED